VLVGEQPGDEEDKAGLPFVGPAGRVLRAALAVAGIAEGEVYITNAVKHFNWEPRGKRRMHKTPRQREIEACNAWLAAEIARIQPRVVVALGRTALAALHPEQPLKIADARTRPLTLRSGTPLVVTFHPAALLRAFDDRQHRTMREAFETDLRRAAGIAQAASSDAGPAVGDAGASP
jgi:DNA polymerase